MYEHFLEFHTRLNMLEHSLDSTLKVRCDDLATIYLDGELKATTAYHTQTATILISEENSVVGIKCQNTGGPYGIRGEVIDPSGNVVMVTDKSWKCSNKLQDGWSTAGFIEDDTWQRATLKGTNVIWTSSGQDGTVYCRKYLPSVRLGFICDIL